MTEPTRAAEVECLHCGKAFAPRKAGHVFCSSDCRHRGARKPEDREEDAAAVERLFDAARDPGERVRADEWFWPVDTPLAWRELYAGDTVAQRRRWYLNLRRERR